ncbi:hypothetical protein quinque_009707 [Culex quinquefasciatus]
MENQENKPKKDNSLPSVTPTLNDEWSRKMVKARLLDHGYRLGKVIGEGSYSKVYYSEHRLHLQQQQQFPERSACKIIDRKQSTMEYSQFLPREIKTMTALSHPNIVAVHSVFEFGPYVCIFMDYCRCGDLLQRILQRGKLSQAKARNFFRQLVSAVRYMHCQGFCHRDIKCENVLLSGPAHLKLSDFTFAKQCPAEEASKQLSKTFCGSVAYAAPEILKGILYDPKRYDMWSLGCVLFVMVTGTMPFDETNVPETIHRQETKQYFYPEGVMLNPTLLELIDSLIEPDVERRANVEQVVECLWLKEQDA